jgi:LmbE family N-acetylglucosaminyl deacetylase
MTNKLSLVAIFAHPDDEAFGTGGTLTKYAQEGVDVHLIMATRGEAGRIANPAINLQGPMGVLREKELRHACCHYGVRQLHMLGYVDGQTAIVPPAEAVHKIVMLLRQISPQVVLSFGPEGIYGHFDHLVVHRWASAAIELAARPDYGPELGSAHQVAKFYYRALPQEAVERMELTGGRAAVDMGGVPFPFVGYPSSQISTIINVQEVAHIKLNAIRSHLSQIRPDMPLLQEDFDPKDNDWFWQETYILAQRYGEILNRPIVETKEHDLFAGVK